MWMRNVRVGFIELAAASYELAFSWYLWNLIYSDLTFRNFRIPKLTIIEAYIRIFFLFPIVRAWMDTNTMG